MRNWTADDGNQQQTCSGRLLPSQPATPACRQPGFRAPLPLLAQWPRQSRACPMSTSRPRGSRDQLSSPAALSGSMAEGVRARESAKLSWEVPVPAQIETKHVTRGHQREKRLAAAGGRLSPRRRPRELGPEPAVLVLSGTHLVSHPKQGKPPRCAGKLQCRLAAFRPPSSSEHRRCYTSRTLSVWSPESLPSLGFSCLKAFFVTTLGPLSISFVSLPSFLPLPSSSHGYCYVCS